MLEPVPGLSSGPLRDPLMGNARREEKEERRGRGRERQEENRVDFNSQCSSTRAREYPGPSLNIISLDPHGNTMD
jgi:hypothetical protein